MRTCKRYIEPAETACLIRRTDWSKSIGWATRWPRWMRVGLGDFHAGAGAHSRVEPKGPGGRPAYEPLLMFKILIIQSLYGLSDEQTQFQILDRRSFSLLPRPE